MGILFLLQESWHDSATQDFSALKWDYLSSVQAEQTEAQMVQTLSRRTFLFSKYIFFDFHTNGDANIVAAALS